MPSSLIRGKYVGGKVKNRHEAHVIEDGAVFQRDGVIVETGKFEALSKKHAADEVLGSERHIVFRGFVNCQRVHDALRHEHRNAGSGQGGRHRDHGLEAHRLYLAETQGVPFYHLSCRH